MRVGILAVQGAFAEHAACLKALGIPFVFLREAQDAKGLDGLILPGGESTTQTKLLRETGLYAPLFARIQEGMPVLATCAGLILLAREVEGGEPCFGELPVQVCRNAYGRQTGSFSARGDVGEIENFPLRFIRAPFIAKVLSPQVEVLNETDGRITAVRYRAMTALAFHPEISGDLRVHRAFVHSLESGAKA